MLDNAERIGLEQALETVCSLSDIYANAVEKGANYIVSLHPSLTKEHAIGVMLGGEVEKLQELIGQVKALEEAFPTMFRLEWRGNKTK